jgi:hypothetical protein
MGIEPFTGFWAIEITTEFPFVGMAFIPCCSTPVDHEPNRGSRSAPILTYRSTEPVTRHGRHGRELPAAGPR